MARHIFSSSVLGSVMLAVLLVGLSGCRPAAEEEKKTTPTTEAPAEKAETPAKEAPVKKEEPAKETPVKKEAPAEKEATAPAEQPKPVEPKEAAPEKTKPEEKTEAKAAPAPVKTEKPSPEEKPVLTEEEVVEVIAEPKVDLGLPLVDNLDKFTPLQKNKAAWVNREAKQVVMVGQVCQRNAPLEMFVCQKNTKEHESVLAVDTTAQAIHAALLLVGAEPGHPVQYQPEYKVATGTPIAIDVIWKDKDGKIQKAKAQEWIKNVNTGKAMDHDWVFAGSGFWENKDTGEKMYLAEQGDFICVSNFPTAMLDLPIRSSDKEKSLLFQAWKEHIPPLGTPVTIVLKPKSAKK